MQINIERDQLTNLGNALDIAIITCREIAANEAKKPKPDLEVIHHNQYLIQQFHETLNKVIYPYL